jgi:hypothetical protein
MVWVVFTDTATGQQKHDDPVNEKPPRETGKPPEMRVKSDRFIPGAGGPCIRAVDSIRVPSE